MSSSREKILNRLRAAKPALGNLEPTGEPLPVVPRAGSSPQELLERFVQQAEQLACVVYQPGYPAEAIRLILDLLGEESRISGWAYEHIPLPGLAEAFAEHGIEIAAGRDASVRIGITGVDSALAATGSIVLLTGEGRPRLASLLPPVHIAVVHQNQIVADLETWVQAMRQKGLNAFQDIASAMIISGPSRTADIAMQLILGMHGPGELHIIVLE